MNEFPGGFNRAWEEMAQQGDGKSGVVGVTGTEYLELIEAAGCTIDDYPTCQAIGQHQIWSRVSENNYTPEAVADAIAQLKEINPNFHMDGASWTNHLSWVNGYENVLTPMNKLSALFHQTLDSWQQSDSSANLTQQTRYREALLNNMLLETSCFRYWGQGMWTDYAREIYRRGEMSLQNS